MASPNRSLFLSDQFAISCGTVTADVERSQALLIRCRRTGECMLPKGRKDLGEALEQTAKRETFEETGVRVELLPASIDTLATLPSSVKEQLTKDRPITVTEPIAVTQRITRGTLKIIFWFIAAADSTAAREEGTQQDDEHFDTAWTDFEDVTSTLTFDDDRRVAQAALAAVRRHLVTAS